MTLGERIKKVRKALDLTQEEFGKRIGIKSNSISLIESGNRNASEQVVLSICREFDVNETWLRTSEGEMFTNAPNSALEELVVDFYLDAFDEALIREYLLLTPNQRKMIRTFFYRVFMKSTGDSGADEMLKTEMGYLSTAKTSQELSVEQEVELEVERYRQQLLTEKRQASQASSVKESGLA